MVESDYTRCSIVIFNIILCLLLNLFDHDYHFGFIFLAANRIFIVLDMPDLSPVAILLSKLD